MTDSKYLAGIQRVLVGNETARLDDGPSVGEPTVLRRIVRIVSRLGQKA